MIADRSKGGIAALTSHEPVLRIRVSAAVTVSSLLPASASAHTFGRLYNLPVPFWLYGFGAAAALVLSFGIVGFLVASPESAPAERARDIAAAALGASAAPRSPGPGAAGGERLRAAAVRPHRSVRHRQPLPELQHDLLLDRVPAGVRLSHGNRRRSVRGDQSLARDRAGDREGLPGLHARRVRYPPALAYWPALCLYMAFIWIELFGRTRPVTLAAYLLAYTGMNLVGVWLFGSAAWFRYCEFLSVFLRLLGRISPFEYRPEQPDGAASRLRWRVPFSGLVTERAESPSLLVFVLFIALVHRLRWAARDRGLGRAALVLRGLWSGVDWNAHALLSDVGAGDRLRHLLAAGVAVLVSRGLPALRPGSRGA
jgi:hypothetical protein